MLGFGYEGLSVEDLVDRLVEARVDVVVDVRLNAISRKPGFSKRALGEALASAGIEYVHDRRLGNPRENRAAFGSAVSVEGRDARDRVRALLISGEGAEAVRDLVALSERSSVALLCFEADGDLCHREQVREAVEDLRSSLVGV